MDHRQYFSKETFEPAVWLVCIYLIGLLLWSYPPLRLSSGDMILMRPDWFLSLPLLCYWFFLKQSIVINKASRFFGVFIAVVFGSAIVNQTLSQVNFLTVFLQLGYIVLLFSVLMGTRLNGTQIRIVFRFWLLLVMIACLYGIYQAVALNTLVPFISLYGSASEIAAPYFGYNRPRSFFAEPALFSQVALSGMAILLPAIQNREPLFFTVRQQWVVFGTATLGLLLSGAFSGYIVAAISVSLLLLVPNIGLILHQVFVLGIVGLAISFTAAAYGVDFFVMITERLGILVKTVINAEVSTGGGSIDIRLARAYTAILALLDKPLLGVSPGGFDTWVQTTSSSTLPVTQKPLTKTHGGWIQLLALTGIFGFISFSGGWISVLRDFVKPFKQLPDRQRWLLSSCLILTLVQLVIWLFNNSFINVMRWSLIGLGYSYVLTKRRDDE